MDAGKRVKGCCDFRGVSIASTRLQSGAGGGGIARVEEEKQNKTADIVGQALLKTCTEKSQDQAKQGQNFTQRIGIEISVLPVTQADLVVGAKLKTFFGVQDQSAS